MKQHALIWGLFLTLSCPFLGAMDRLPSLEELTLDEKIGQLLMLATVSNQERNKEFMARSPYRLDPIDVNLDTISFKAGGIIFLGAGTPEEQSNVTRDFQNNNESPYPLLVALDAEWGPSMRLTGLITPFAKAMTLGALSEDDDDLIRDLGFEIGFELKSLGVHINCAPVVDINSNPQNPVINVRSFGEDPKKVTCKARLMMEGMMQAGTFPVLKHFPGHGDTDIDSHHALPVINHERKRLDEIELAPYRKLIAQGAPIIMTGHLAVPSLTGEKDIPATFSKKIISLLRDELGFDGVIMTDGLGMQAVQDGKEPGEAEFRALKAGHDLLLCPVNVMATVRRIKKGIVEGEINEQEINEHVRRILRLKKGLSKTVPPFDQQTLTSRYAQQLKKRLYESAITYVKKRTDSPQTSCIITIGDCSHFLETLNQMATYQFQITSSAYCLSQCSIANSSDEIIIALTLPSRSGMIEMGHENNNETSLPAYVDFINRHGKKVTLVLFGNPYNLSHFNNLGAAIVAYENDPDAQQAAAEVLLGKREARGNLPISLQ